MIISPFNDTSTQSIGKFILIISATAGYNTSEIDQFRQGVEIRNSRDRYNGIFKISAGTEDHVIEESVFGQVFPFEEGLPFEEKDRLTQCIILSGSNNIGQSELDSNFLDDSQLNGTLEPLNIRDVATFSSIESPFVAHSIKGHLQEGNEQNLFGGSDTIIQFVEIKTASISDPYLDSSELFVSGSAVSISTPGPFFGAEKIINAYNETIRLRPALITTSSMSNDMISVLASSSNNSIAEELFPLGYISAAAGWNFEGNQIGTDSISFGGMKE